MSTTIDEVMETVREARHRGPDALAALALCYGADAVGWMIRHAALRRELLDAERGMDEAREERDALRHERDAALAECKAARQSADEAREFLRIARDDAEMFARQRDEARSRVEDAVREREAFSLRASAAERGRDEARQERDAALARPTYEARTVAPTEEERRAHIDADGAWLVVDGDTGFLLIGAITQGAGTGSTWIPLGADGLPCAWPVVP